MLPQIIIAATRTFGDGCFFGSVITVFIVGSIALIYIDRLKRQLIAKAHDEGYDVGYIIGKKDGIKVAEEVAAEEVRSRPWQSVAPVHVTASDAPKRHLACSLAVDHAALFALNEPPASEGK